MFKSLRKISFISVMLLTIRVSNVQPQQQSLYPSRNIISSIIERFLYNESENIIDINVQLINTTELLRKWGLSSETHRTKTQDGYTLTMHRIVPKYANSPPVLLQHGLCLASDSWILRGQEDLAIILHNNGYDVWMGNKFDKNVTGKRYPLNIKYTYMFLSSKRSVNVCIAGMLVLSLLPSNEEVTGKRYPLNIKYTYMFLSSKSNRSDKMRIDTSNPWRFNFIDTFASWHEHGLYDVPAMIDYILSVTRRPTLSYIGHSMGTTMFYVMASMRPEYNRKINLQISLAPVAYVSRMKSYPLVFKHFADNIKYITKVLRKNRKYEILERRLANPIAIICKDPTLRPICYQAAFLIIGPDLYQMPDENIITAILTHFPAGTSFKNVIHYLQNIKALDFQGYDYGHFENMRRYGNFFSPRYNLSAITAPVALFYSNNDYLSHPAVRMKTTFIISFLPITLQ
ncbi:lipase 1 [Diaphorina citri]|uniref:Lipase 1 n=1 Tax=Diaphorina citri TaxID=121845 RepID=A0A3Q0ITP8_DIACI|nr:lipase 1 [Diaphorina citri]